MGRTVRHVVTGLTLTDSDETSAVHLLFRVHPVSARTALFISAPQRCAAVSGMSSDQTRDTISYLFEHSTRRDNVYRHRWCPGDVVIWDNRVVMHCADHSDVAGDRVMHRGMVAATLRSRGRRRGRVAAAILDVHQRLADGGHVRLRLRVRFHVRLHLRRRLVARQPFEAVVEVVHVGMANR